MKKKQTTGIKKAKIVNANVDVCGGDSEDELASLDVVNADVNASAAIAYSKLNLGTSIVNADVSGSAAIVESKLSLASDAAAGTASRRTLAGTGSATSAAKSDHTHTVYDRDNGQLGY